MQSETWLRWWMVLELSLLVFGGDGDVSRICTGISLDNNKLLILAIKAVI